MQVQDKNRYRRATATLAVVCLVCQLALAPQLGPLAGLANFSLVFAVCMALLRGGEPGVLSGFLAGVVFDLATTGPMGLMALLLTVTTYLLGSEGRNRVADDPQLAWLQGAVACLLVQLAYALVQLAVGQSSSLVEAVVFRALPSGVLTALLLVPFVWATARQGHAGLGLGGSSRRGMPRSSGPELGKARAGRHARLGGRRP